MFTGSRFRNLLFSGVFLIAAGSGCSSDVGPAVISLNPLNPYHFDTLEVKLEVPATGRNGKPLTDLDYDYEYEIAWYVDGERKDTYEGPIIAPPDDYDRQTYKDNYQTIDWTINDGEVWRVVVTPRDRGSIGPSSSAEVTVNTRPTVAPKFGVQSEEGDSSVDLVLETGLEETDEGLEVDGVIEEEPEPSYTVTWYQNEVLFEEDTTNLEIRAEDINKNDKWEAEVTPFTVLGDGREQEIAYGATVRLAQQMYNQAPLVTGVEVLAVTDMDLNGNETSLAGADTYVCNVSMSDVDNEDELLDEVVWEYKAQAGLVWSLLTSASATIDHDLNTLADADLQIGDLLQCKATPEDLGGAVGAELPSGAVSIGNTAPVVTSVEITNNTNVDNLADTISVGDEIQCEWEAEDYDQGILTIDDVAVVWERLSDGAEFTDNPLFLVPEDGSGNGFQEDDELVCKVTPTDELGLPGLEVISASVQLIGTPNALPEVSNVSVQPDPASAGVDLQCTYEWFDADLNDDEEPRDPDLSQFEWTVNGTVVEGSKWVDVDVKLGRACAIDATGQGHCWGQGLDHYSAAEDPTGAEVNAQLPRTVRFAKISLGWDHDCGLSVDGDLYCWGREDGGPKDFGQVWDAPSGTFTDVASGSGYSCVLDEVGAVTCWGNDEYLLNSTTPTGEGFTHLVAGPDMACALDSTDTIVCWGNHSAEMNSMTAVNDFNNGHQAMDLTFDVLCILDDDLSPSCWDYSSDVTQIERWFPPFASGYQDLSVGLQHACAVTKKDQINCWGEEGPFGFISDAPAGDPDTPEERFVSVAAGAYESCAVSESGEITCWGSMPAGWDDSVITEAPVGLSPTGPMLFGGAELGDEVSCTVTPFDGMGYGVMMGSDPVTVDNTLPSASSVAIEPAEPGHREDLVCTANFSDDEQTLVEGAYEWTIDGGVIEGPNWEFVSAGSQHSCALDQAGQVVCWGNDALPAVSHRMTGSGYTWVSAGLLNYTCAIDSAGAVVCDGDDEVLGSPNGGGSGDAETNNPAIFLESPETGTFTQVVLGDNYACALDSEGGIACWGGYADGATAGEYSIAQVTEAPPNSGYTALAAGKNLACALDSVGAIVCWGVPDDNAGEPHGNTFLIDEGCCSMPEDSGYTQVAIGTRHACALSEDGEIHCWGTNAYGQVQDAPEVTEFVSFVSIAAASDRSCAVDSYGFIDCWGFGLNRSDPDAATDPLFTDKPLQPDYTAVSMGTDYACALRKDWEIDCWGITDETSEDQGQVTKAPSGFSIWGDTLLGEATEVGDEITCTVSPYDGIAYGDPLTSDPVTVLNTVPSVANVHVNTSPNPAEDHDIATTSDTLYCHYDFEDGDGDADWSTIVWKVNGVDPGVDSDGDSDPKTLNGGYAEGDTVKCVVTAHDDLQEGNKKQDGITINYAPSVDNVRVSTASDPAVAADPVATASDTLWCHYDFDDVDGVVDLSPIVWLVNGVEKAENSDSDGDSKTLAIGFGQLDVVQCKVTPDDGIEMAAEAESAPITINDIPFVTDVSITPADPKAGDTLNCAYTFVDAEGTDTSSIAWTNQDGEDLGAGASLSSGFVRADKLTCTVTPDDGIEQGSAATVAITIDNANPVVDDLAIVATTDVDGDGDPTTAGTNDTIRCAYTFSDPDGDGDVSQVDWEWASGKFDNHVHEITPHEEKGSDVTCRVTPRDEHGGEGTPENMSITIGNTLPSVSGLSLTATTDEDGDGDSTTAIATDYLQCAWTVSDPDLDFADNTTVEFFEAGTISLGSGLPHQHTSTLGGGQEKGDSITCTVTPADSEGTGPALTSDPLIIANAVPTVSDVTVISTTDEDGDGLELTAGAADTLECSYTFSDVDGDTEASSAVDWVVNGSSAGSGTTLSGVFSDGDAVGCTVTPNDGEVDGLPVTSQNELTIGGWVFVEVSAGSETICALTSLGTIECWGADNNGQVSGAPTTGSFESIGGRGYHFCALTTAGNAQCWGADWNGEATPPADTFISLAAGYDVSCGVTSSEEIQCWGSDDGSTVSAAPTSTGWAQVSVGGADPNGVRSCALTSSGGIECWGGTSDTPPSGTYTSVSAGGAHRCAVQTDGAVACWGDDMHGQASAPSGTFTSVSAGDEHTCGVASDGSVQCWGLDDHGPATAPAGSFTSVSAAASYTCAISSVGDVECWGNPISGSAPCPSDADCDGLVTVLDCDDHDAGNLNTTDDCDGDGVPAGQDCDDTDDTITYIDDCDQDGEPTATDCDDTNPLVQLTTNDADCDGFATTADCDDGDPNSTYECIELSAGGYHTCLIDPLGELNCWGAGEVVGYCDQSTDVDCGQSIPPAGTFQNVSGAGAHSCGVLDDGSVQCWGADNGDVFDWGQVSSTPTTGDFSSVAAGTYHSCAVSVSTGAVECWGAGETVGICNSATSSYECGQSIPPAGSFDSVSGGFMHTCGLKTDGMVECWGDNTAGQSSPPGVTFVQLSAGVLHTCGIESSGAIACWGYNATDQTNAPGGSFTSLSAGGYHTCAIDSGGYLQCWGSGTSANNCDLSTGGFDCGQSAPPAGSNYVRVSAGDFHTCALTDEGSVECWGDASFGQLEPWCLDDEDCDGLVSAEDCDDTDPSSSAVADDGDCDGVFTADDCDDGDSSSTVVADDADCDGVLTTVDCDDTDPARGLCTGELVVSAGAYHTCAIDSSAGIQCWGDDIDSQVSNSPGGIGFYVLDAGGYHTCGLTYAGELSCWGDDTQGQITGTPTSGDFLDLASGEDHSCGLDDAGLITCWGLDDWGQVSGPNGSATLYSQVVAGASHTCAMNASDGSAECWGIDDGSTDDYAQVTDTPLTETFLTLSAGEHFTCGVTATSALACWGIDGVSNSLDTAGQFLDFGQVWDAPTSGTFSSVSGGFFHACAIDATDDTVQCWGITDLSESDFGQVSDASTDNFSSLSSGLFHTCGVTTANTVSCWGSDTFGQSTVPGL